MNRTLIFSILLGLSLSSMAEEHILPPSKDIFAGLDQPAATTEAAVAQPTKPAVDPVKQAERQQAASAASSAVTTLTQLPPAVSGGVVPLAVYTQEELIVMIDKGLHLQRVKREECQLSADIEARAKVLMLPAYQYLWGEMLTTGTCVAKDAELGVEFLSGAANQGFPPALQKLATYYDKGIYVQRDRQQAAVLMHEAAALDYVQAQMAWVAMLNRGLGSPLDYEEAYSWLHHSVISDPKQHAEATRLLRHLAARMPANVVARAKSYRLN